MDFKINFYTRMLFKQANKKRKKSIHFPLITLVSELPKYFLTKTIRGYVNVQSCCVTNIIGSIVVGISVVIRVVISISGGIVVCCLRI